MSPRYLQPLMMVLGSALTLVGAVFLALALFTSSNYIFFGGQFAGYQWYTSDIVGALSSLIAAGSLVRAATITAHEELLRQAIGQEKEKE